MKKTMKMKASKGAPPKMMKEKKSLPSKGDRMSDNAAKTRDVRSLVSQKKGADGTAIKQEKKLSRQNLKKKLEGVKF